ncbi:hypothetical protein VTK26DRAFT_6205 [Humicola hyalothermophila]
MPPNPSISLLFPPLLLLLLATTHFTTAHMQLTYPPPLRSRLNPHTRPSDIDYSLTSPLSPSGPDYPCRGALALLGTPTAAPVATWTAGAAYNFTVAGGAPHGGGSCQAALSVDGGRAFRVLRSYVGGCPSGEAGRSGSSSSSSSSSSSWAFRVPRDVGSVRGAVFAWGWYNRLGNREFYQNCAVVDVVAVVGGGLERVPFGTRPEMFKANVGNGCTTVEGKDVEFPDPGPDVDWYGGDLAPPRGSCGADRARGGSGDAFRGGEGSGAGSGAGTGSDHSDYGEHGEQTGDSSGSSPTSCPSPYNSQSPDAVSDHGDGIGWTPGNDWPDWFMNTAPRTSTTQILWGIALVALAHFVF